jgi:hypothetical protein
MLDPDAKTTLREFKEYLDLSYEPPPRVRCSHWCSKGDHLVLAFR